MAEQVSIKDFLRKREMATQELKFEGFASPFVITEVSNEENEKLQKAATRTNKNQYGQVVRQVDQDKYADALVVKSVVQPDLNSKELQEFYGTLADPLGTLKKMLSMGELTRLVKAVNTLSLGDTLEEKVDEAKN